MSEENGEEYTEITETLGFKFAINPLLRKCDFIEICDKLKEQLTTFLNPIIDVVPEPRIEGGIRIIYKNPSSYKFIRLNLFNFPHITENTAEEWRNNTDLLELKPYNNVKYTFARLFATNAPIFTRKELEIIKSIFGLYGMKVSCFKFNSIEL